jgi:hypothetical protein
MLKLVSERFFLKSLDGFYCYFCYSIVMHHQSVQLDPLNSPYPVPWNWILATQAEGGHAAESQVYYYRSQSLLSPDERYAAYSRIQLRVCPDGFSSQVTSVLLIENLETGDLQTITPESPFADNPFLAPADNHRPGRIAILIPVSWSAQSDRVLAREFESQFGTDIASDFAVVWDRTCNQVVTFAPNGPSYTNAILLGWSQQYPNHALFRAGTMGEEDWPTWAVDVTGMCHLVFGDAPIGFGRVMNHVWAGPQPRR